VIIMLLNDIRHRIDKVGDFWEVFDHQNNITMFASEDRNNAIIARNYLNKTLHFKVIDGNIVESDREIPDVLRFPMEETVNV